MEEEEDMSPPFWLQNGGGDRRRLRRSYSLFLNSGALVIILVVTALAFTLVVAPTLHSFTSHIFKPHSVKKSWDSLNLVLVLFAIFCGFLSRNNTNETPRSYEDQTSTFSDTRQEYEKPNPETETETPRPWYEYEYSDRTRYNRLRSFRSYPDLRQESSWVAGDERWRFYDDTRVNGYRGLYLDAEEEEEKEEQGIKNIEVDTYVARGGDVGRNTKRTYQPEKTIEKPKNNASGEESSQQRTEKKHRRASATKELLTSLKGKKKKQRHKSVEIFQSIPNSEPSSHSHPPPPPPPPPPPSSVFHNLFSPKKSKRKKLNSATSPPKHRVSSMLVSKTKPVQKGVLTLKPRESNFLALDENVMTGNESPLIPIPPPPPPPPPFKMPAWKFRVQGDFVRIDSFSSSSSGSPDTDEVVESPTTTSTEASGEPAILLVYPNPDVDRKADSFIETFRAGLRTEKLNSTQHGIGRSKSNLCPSSNELINATLS